MRANGQSSCRLTNTSMSRSRGTTKTSPSGFFTMSQSRCGSPPSWYSHSCPPNPRNSSTSSALIMQNGAFRMQHSVQMQNMGKVSKRAYFSRLLSLRSKYSVLRPPSGIPFDKENWTQPNQRSSKLVYSCGGLPDILHQRKGDYWSGVFSLLIPPRWDGPDGPYEIMHCPVSISWGKIDRNGVILRMFDPNFLGKSGLHSRWYRLIKISSGNGGVSRGKVPEATIGKQSICISEPVLEVNWTE